MLKLRKKNLSYKKKKNIEHLIDNLWQHNINTIDLPYFQNKNQLPNYSLSINEEGNIIAIGLPYVNNFKGLVRIFYINEDQTFTQIGNDLVGENESDQFGFDVKLNGNGMILAVSIPNFDNSISMEKGKVKVYEYNNSTLLWTQMGFDLKDTYEDQQFGYKIDISSDGNTLAISAPYKNTLFDDGNINKYRSGQIFIFKYKTLTNDEWNRSELNIMKGFDTSCDIVNSTDFSCNGNKKYWIQLGNPITYDFEQHNTLIGESFSLSKNGQRIALGVSRYDHIIDDSTIRIDDGKVFVLEYRQISSQNEWDSSNILKGNDAIFEDNKDNFYWIQLGNEINGNNDQIGSSVSLNYDGSILAYSSSKDNGYIKAFEYKDQTWTQMGDTIQGQSKQNEKYNINLDNDGKVIVIGNGLEKGEINIYKFNQNAKQWNHIQNINKSQSNTSLEETNNQFNLGEVISLNSKGNKILSCSMSYFFDVSQQLILSEKDCDSSIYNVIYDDSISISGEFKLDQEVTVNSENVEYQWSHVNKYENCYADTEVIEITNANQNKYKISQFDYLSNNYLAIKLKYNDGSQKIKIINLIPVNFKPIINIYSDTSFVDNIPVPIYDFSNIPTPLHHENEHSHEPIPLSDPSNEPIPLSDPSHHEDKLSHNVPVPFYYQGRRQSYGPVPLNYEERLIQYSPTPFIHKDEHHKSHHSPAPFIHKDEHHKLQHSPAPFIHKDEHHKSQHSPTPFIHKDEHHKLHHSPALFIHKDDRHESQHSPAPFIHKDEHHKSQHSPAPFIHKDEHHKSQHSPDPFIQKDEHRKSHYSPAPFIHKDEHHKSHYSPAPKNISGSPFINKNYQSHSPTPFKPDLIDEIPIHNDTKSIISISYNYNVISSDNLNRLKEIICVEVISEINRWCDINLIQFSNAGSNLNLTFQTNFISNKGNLKDNLLKRFSQNSIDINDINIT